MQFTPPHAPPARMAMVNICVAIIAVIPTTTPILYELAANFMFHVPHTPRKRPWRASHTAAKPNAGDPSFEEFSSAATEIDAIT